MTKLLTAFAFAALAVSLAPSARASGSIYVSYGACASSPSTLGYTDIVWSVTGDEPDDVDVWVTGYNYHTAAGGTPNLEAGARSGENYNPWIQYQYDYWWDLLSGTNGYTESGNYLGTATFLCG